VNAQSHPDPRTYVQAPPRPAFKEYQVAIEDSKGRRNASGRRGRKAGALRKLDLRREGRGQQQKQKEKFRAKRKFLPASPQPLSPIYSLDTTKPKSESPAAQIEEHQRSVYPCIGTVASTLAVPNPYDEPARHSRGIV
jgi:hypothetical protein